MTSVESHTSILKDLARPVGVHKVAGDSPEAPPAPLRPDPNPEGGPHCGRWQLSAAAGVLHKPLRLRMSYPVCLRVIAARQASGALAAPICIILFTCSQTSCMSSSLQWLGECIVLPVMTDYHTAIRTWDLRRSWAHGSPLSWTTQLMIRTWPALGAPQLLQGAHRQHQSQQGSRSPNQASAQGQMHVLKLQQVPCSRQTRSRTQHATQALQGGQDNGDLADMPSNIVPQQPGSRNVRVPSSVFVSQPHAEARTQKASMPEAVKRMRGPFGSLGSRLSRLRSWAPRQLSSARPARAGSCGWRSAGFRRRKLLFTPTLSLPSSATAHWLPCSWCRMFATGAAAADQESMGKAGGKPSGRTGDKGRLVEAEERATGAKAAPHLKALPCADSA